MAGGVLYADWGVAAVSSLILVAAWGVLGLEITVIARGEFEVPPSRCWGGTVTVMAAVMTGTLTDCGMGSDTEITTLEGAPLLLLALPAVWLTGATGC